MATLFNGLWVQASRGYLAHQWEVLLLDTYDTVRGECLSITYEGHQTSDPDADLGVPCALADLPAEAYSAMKAFASNYKRGLPQVSFWRCACQRTHFHPWSESQCPVCSDRRDHDGVPATAIVVLKSLNGWWYRVKGVGCDGCELHRAFQCEHPNSGFGDGEDGGTACRDHIWRGWWPHMDLPAVEA